MQGELEQNDDNDDIKDDFGVIKEHVVSVNDDSGENVVSTDGCNGETVVCQW